MHKTEQPHMPTAKAPLMTAEEITAFLNSEFPQIHEGGKVFAVEAAAYGRAWLRMAYHQRLLRPGGTISGPSMFALADVAMYVAVLSAIGPRALAVTTSLNINFLRRPAPRDLIAEARLLKLGKRLAVGDIALRSEGEEELVAHATATYSIPDEDAPGSRSSVR
jgi:uncharacterized protein (TIGR00369 family)